MRLLLSILANDLFPVFAVAGVGFLLARFVGIDVRVLSRIVFFSLSPCLVFHSLLTSTLEASHLLRMVLFATGVIGMMGVLAWAAAFPLRLARPELSALLIVTMFSNSGNYGLPAILFAFGREALTHATIYFVTNALLMYTVGVFIASAGRRNLRAALLGVFRVPVVYGALLAVLVMATGRQLPLPLLRPVALLSDATIPAMLLVLGMQLERGCWPKRPLLVGLTAVLVLVVSPLLGFGLAKLLGLSGAARQAGIAQAAMPAAVVNTILAIEYDVQPSFVTAAVFVSTLLSPITITIVIALLQGN